MEGKSPSDAYQQAVIGIHVLYEYMYPSSTCIHVCMYIMYFSPLLVFLSLGCSYMYAANVSVMYVQSYIPPRLATYM